MWAMLPFRVLVVRTIRDARTTDDVTVSAESLLRTLGDPNDPTAPNAPNAPNDPDAPPPRRRDEAWLWPVPLSRGHVVERIPQAEVARLGAAASSTLRQVAAQGVGGRALGERAVRDALLDHVPIVVTGPDGERIDVPQRLVQAVVRMGFLRHEAGGPPQEVTFGETSITVRRSGPWIGLDASYGSAWYRPVSSLGLS